MTTLDDLLKEQTKDEVLEQLVALFRMAGFPTASWAPFTLLRHVAEFQAFFFGLLTGDIRAIAKGGLLGLAEDGWLDLVLEHVFNDARKAAVFTRGTVVLTDAGSVGPVTINPGAYWISDAAGTRRFRNVDGGTLPLNGTLTVTVEAEAAGAVYNVAAETLVLLAPSVAGVTVSNPADVATGTWITQQGADEESDAAARQRMRDKWATLGSGSTIGAFRYWATSASAEVARVRAVADLTTGSVAVTIAGISGPVSAGALTLAQAAVEANRPLCCAATVANAVAQAEAVAGTLYLAPGANAAATLAAAQAAIDAYARELDIGGTVVRSRIIAAGHVTGVRSFVLTSPAADVVLAADAVWTPTYAGLVTAA